MKVAVTRWKPLFQLRKCKFSGLVVSLFVSWGLWARRSDTLNALRKLVDSTPAVGARETMVPGLAGFQGWWSGCLFPGGFVHEGPAQRSKEVGGLKALPVDQDPTHGSAAWEKTR